jgi:hypothetical protein
MGNLPSLWDEQRAESSNHKPKNNDSVTIKLSCADFGTFNGRSDQWIHFQENTLSKAGVGGYAQYFKQEFQQTENNRDGNNRIFYLLQTATNGGGASHVVRKHAATADGAAAWQALMGWYEGPVMSGEIAKNLRTKLWALKLQSKGDVNKHINDFTLYMDQLKELNREEREETLTDLFLDSIIDPKFEVTIANCRLREYISIYECFEAVRKYDNVISREGMQEGQQKYKIRRLNQNKRQRQQDKSKVDSSYRTYAEWQKLTPEQRSKILELREKEKENNNKDGREIEQENEDITSDTNNNSWNRNQRNRKRIRRQTNMPENDYHNENDQHGDAEESE